MVILAMEMILIIWQITDDLLEGFSFYSWNISEILINYEGGFVRRGLLGQMIYVACNTFSFSTYYTVISICVVSLGVYFYLFFKGFLNKKIPPFIAGSVLLAAAPVFSRDWVRKDVLIIVFFILILKLFYTTAMRSTLMANLLLSVGILIHESLFFITFPILTFLQIAENKCLHLTFNKFYSFVIPIFTFLTVCIFSGNEQTVEAILNSWNLHDKTIENAVTSLSWSLEFGVRIAFAQGKAFTDNGLIFPPLVWLIISASVFYILINLSIFFADIHKKLKYRKFMLTVALIQLTAVVPLFILGCDYGRWFFYWSSTSIAAFLFVPENTVDYIIRFMRIKDSFFTENPIFVSEKMSLYILFIILGIPGYIMNTENYLNSTFIYKMITKLSLIFNYFL